VDDGVQSRGHRLAIFDPRFAVVGISIGPHKTFGQVCVMDFAAAYVDDEQVSKNVT
jgi:uncharacterized protein YkwD